MTTGNLRGSLLLALQKHACIYPEEFSKTSGFAIEPVLASLRRLRFEGRCTGSGRGLHSYVPNSDPSLEVIQQRRRVERERRKQAAANALLAAPTLSLVRSAQINSPTSVWAYAARSAA